MYGMMATNIAIPEQKKRGNNSNCPDIAKYFATPKIGESVANNPATNEEIQDYFKRSCAPLDLSQPGNTIYPRPSMHGASASDVVELAGKWPPARNEHECDVVMKYYKTDVNMERIERQMFQDMDPRMCHTVVDKGIELVPNQRLYQESALTLKYGRDMKAASDLHNNMYAMPHAMKHEVIDDKAPMNNAYAMMMPNDRPVHGRDDMPPLPKNPISNSDCLYSGESHPYKWVPDLNTSLDEFKLPENEMRDQRQELISLVNMDTCPASMPLDNNTPADPICTKSQPIYAPNNNVPPAPPPPPPPPEEEEEEQNVQVISYEEFLKSEGLSVPSKDRAVELNNAGEPVKKQSNIRKFFTRVPRTVEVKFDHKRLVTVTAVVHPQPQSPRKLNAKKPMRKQTTRRPSGTKLPLKGGGGDNAKISYNMRQRKSNVVVDIEEIDLTIKEMNAEANEIPKKPWRPGRRRLRSYHSFDSKTTDSGSDDFKDTPTKEKPAGMPKGRNNSWHQLKVLDPKPLFLACDLPSPKPRRNKRSKSESSKDESEVEPPLEPRKSFFRHNLTENCRKSARLSCSVSEESQLQKDGLKTTEEGLSHKPLKSIYKSTVVQPGASGLRIKLVRIGKKRHHHHHHHQRRHQKHKKHKNAKVRKAMELLQRAKESSFHRESRGGDDSGPRRSTRQSTTIVRKAMEGAKKAEELRQARITAQRASPTKRLQPRRMLEAPPNSKSPRSLQSLRKTGNLNNARSDEKKLDNVNKSPRKLASIFTQSRTRRKEQQLDPKLDEKKGIPVVVLDDAKQQFLRSGIPESLQQLQVARQRHVDHVPDGVLPFAAISHVEQRGPSVEEKPPTVAERFGLRKLSETLFDPSPTIPPPKNTIQLGSLTTISGKVSECYKSQIDKLVSMTTTLKAFPTSVVKDILASISRRSPRLPVKKLYRNYLMKRRKMEKLEVASNQNDASNLKKRPPENDDIIEIKEIVNELKRRKIEAPKNQTGQNESSANKGKDELAAIKNSLQKTEIEKVLAPEVKPTGGTKSTYLWTEKYHPTHSLDIIGNRKTVVQLKNWLLEWREQSKAESRRHKEGLSKKKNKGFSEEDDDFVLSENDDEDYDNTMCNTVLITGPSGMGKTATVYAIAEELGYKVFEVNASSRRAGKQILAELKEATQSHQVSMKSKKITSLFQPTKKGSQKDFKENCKEDKENPETNDNGNNNNTYMSLVLFEDVDLVFDNDDGFWQAVNSFMSTTKRPIVLTSSVESFGSTGTVKGRFEEFKFRTPEPSLTAIHMQVLCLVENLYADFDDIYSLVYHNGGDVRKTILEIQYWVLSGGDKKALEETLQGSSTQQGAALLASAQAKSAGSDGGAIVLLEDSLDPDLFDTFTSGDFSTDNSMDGILENKVNLATKQPMHKGCFESVRGLSVPTSSSIAVMLKTSTDARTSTVLLEQCSAANIETCSHNLPHLLPIPTVCSLEKRKKPSNFMPVLYASVTPNKSKVLDASWISDEGDDGTAKPAEPLTAGAAKDQQKPAAAAAEDVAAASRQQAQKKLCCRALNTLSKLSDCLADLDATFDDLEQESEKGRASKCWKWWYREVKSGSSESASKADVPEVPMLDLQAEMRASVLARSLQIHGRELDGSVKDLKSKEHEVDGLPLVTVETPTTDFLPTLTGLNNSPYMKRRSSNQRVAKCLSPALQASHRPVVLDYMPYVRHICQAETTRQLCNTKRGGRFLHYLDAMPLTPSLLEYLNEEFP